MRRHVFEACAFRDALPTLGEGAKHLAGAGRGKNHGAIRRALDRRNVVENSSPNRPHSGPFLAVGEAEAPAFRVYFGPFQVDDLAQLTTTQREQPAAVDDLVDFTVGPRVDQLATQSPKFLGCQATEAPIVGWAVHSLARIGLDDAFRDRVGQYAAEQAGRASGCAQATAHHGFAAQLPRFFNFGGFAACHLAKESIDVGVVRSMTSFEPRRGMTCRSMRPRSV